MAQILPGYARLTPKGNTESMADQFLWIARNAEEARAQALVGRNYVVREWNRSKAFSDLAEVLHEAAGKPAVLAGRPVSLEHSKSL
jgi:hypothetical protein